MKTKVLIVGGGAAGLALALKLGIKGIKCVVIDPSVPNSYDFKKHGGRTAALMGQSVDLLQSLGLWEEIERDTAPLNTMKIIDDGNPALDPVELSFPANEIDEKNFGHNVPNCYLRELLYQHAQKNENITCLIPDKVTKIEHQNASIVITTEQGEKITADLLVGADGRFSKVREISGIGFKEIDYNQTAITCLVSHSKPHDNISTEHHRPGGPFTMVPMPDQNRKHYSSIVWVEKTDEAQKYLSIEKALVEQTLYDKTRHALGDITLESPLESWPLKALLADKIIAERTALIAEAAHAMSPIGAQGLNLSLRDVDILGDILSEAIQLGEDIGGDVVLSRYQGARHLDLQTRFHGVDKYNKVVSNNIGFVRSLRRGGLNTLKTIPALKKLAMHVGLKPAA
ncbi:MAG: FAD-dependent monooxygenase [Pseudomonadota bacterium]